MKAAQINEYGDASVVMVIDIGKPVAGEGQVVVRVSASSLNPFDTKLRELRGLHRVPPWQRQSSSHRRPQCRSILLVAKVLNHHASGCKDKD